MMRFLSQSRESVGRPLSRSEAKIKRKAPPVAFINLGCREVVEIEKAGM